MNIAAIAAILCLVWLWLTWPPSRDYEQGLVMRISRIAAGVVVVAVLAMVAAACSSATARPVGVIQATTTATTAPPRPQWNVEAICGDFSADAPTRRTVVPCDEQLPDRAHRASSSAGGRR